MTALLINPSRYIQSVSGGLILFATNVLPALFPFFFFSKALTAIGCVAVISSACKRPMRALYNAPPSSAYVFVMSILGGYPIGANLLSSLYELGEINQSDVKIIMSFTSTSGPLFIIGTVACGMFNSTKIGVILLLCHYLGAIFNGLIYRGKTYVDKPNTYTPPAQNLDNALSDIASSSVQNILLVGAYIAIFSMVIDVLIDIKVIPSIVSLLNSIGVPRDMASGVLISLIEITRGILLLSKSCISLKIIVPVVCGILSFGGLAITMQSLAFLGKCKIKASRYLLVKFTQSIIAACFCALVCAFAL